MEKTIPDRTTTSRVAVPPDRHQKENPKIQMILPLAEIVRACCATGVPNSLLRETGLALMQTVMEEEVRHLGWGTLPATRRAPRIARAKRTATAWWTARKYRSRRQGCEGKDKREQRLGSYELFQRSGPLQSGSVGQDDARAIRTRNVRSCGEGFPQRSYGVEKSAVASENFIEASREKVKQLMERPLGELRLCAVLIDGTPSRTSR